jgi:hypothetical protein
MGENGIAWEKMGVNSSGEIKLAILSIIGRHRPAPEFCRRRRGCDRPLGECVIAAFRDCAAALLRREMAPGIRGWSEISVTEFGVARSMPRTNGPVSDRSARSTRLGIVR